MKNSPFITYRHFRRDSGAATAAIIVLPDQEKMLVGFGFCSPEEPSFSRKEGRKHAEKRLRNQPIYLDRGDGIAKACIKYLKSCTGASDGLVRAIAQAGKYQHQNKFSHFDQWFTKFRKEL